MPDLTFTDNNFQKAPKAKTKSKMLIKKNTVDWSCKVQGFLCSCLIAYSMRRHAN